MSIGTRWLYLVAGYQWRHWIRHTAACVQTVACTYLSDPKLIKQVFNWKILRGVCGPLQVVRFPKHLSIHVIPSGVEGSAASLLPKQPNRTEADVSTPRIPARNCARNGGVAVEDGCLDRWTFTAPQSSGFAGGG
jgi:hypothetical protein